MARWPTSYDVHPPDVGTILRHQYDVIRLPDNIRHVTRLKSYLLQTVIIRDTSTQLDSTPYL